MAQVPARAAGVEEISGFRNPVLILIWMHECRGFARCLLMTQSGHFANCHPRRFEFSQQTCHFFAACREFVGCRLPTAGSI